jgi:alpha-glucoside transport system permease protein
MTSTTGDAVLPVTSTPAIAQVEQAGKNAKQKLTSPWASLVAVVLAVLWTTPTFGLLVTSFRPQADIGDNGWWNIFLHPAFTLDNYRDALSSNSGGLGTNFINSIIITIPAVLIPIALASLAAYAFAWIDFKGRDLLFVSVFALQIVPIQVTLIPLFVGFKTLGLVDTIWPLVLPSFFASPFFVFMFRQFFSQIPEELIEAARMDGATNWRVYWQFMLPLSGPVIAIVAIYTFLGSWNDFLGPLIYLNSDENRTLALDLNSFMGQYVTKDTHLLMAASVVCMVPCVLLFFACQKYFVESVAGSAIK